MSIKHDKPNVTLTVSNNGNTLSVISANYFVEMENGEFFSVTLPDVVTMTGQSLTFTTTNSTFESGFSIHGPIDLSDSSFSLNVPSSVTFLSDGNRWWITSFYNN